MKVTLKHLTKKFPNRNKKIHDFVTAVSDFDLEFPDGKLISLLGPSGCGKSTLLNLISGLETATSGSIFFGEDDVTKLPPEHRGVGLVFQNYALYPHLTVEENITFPLGNLRGSEKMTKEQMHKRALEVASFVQIEELLDRKPSEMSGGQQQRVAIARALVKTPKVLLLDEPLSNLDARLRLQTREEIRRIQRQTGVTAIFVTHDQEEAMSISDMIVVMKDGVLHQTGKPQEVYDNPKNLFVAKFLGTPPINVFEGRVENKKLWIGSDEIMEVKGVSDQPVYVGIRPEGFEVDAHGPLCCKLQRIEVMGRDTSVISTHHASMNEVIRSIIPSQTYVDTTKEEIRFSIKPCKLYLFSQNNEERISFDTNEE